MAEIPGLGTFSVALFFRGWHANRPVGDPNSLITAMLRANSKRPVCGGKSGHSNNVYVVFHAHIHSLSLGFCGSFVPSPVCIS